MQVVVFGNWCLAKLQQAPSLCQSPPWGSLLLWLLSRTWAETHTETCNATHRTVTACHGGKGLEKTGQHLILQEKMRPPARGQGGGPCLLRSWPHEVGAPGPGTQPRAALPPARCTTTTAKSACLFPTKAQLRRAPLRQVGASDTVRY